MNAQKSILCSQNTNKTIQEKHTKKTNHLGWRDSSADTSTDCSFKGLEFESQHPHGSLQLSVNSSFKGSHALFWPLCTQVVRRQAHRQNNHTYKIIL